MSDPLDKNACRREFLATGARTALGALGLGVRVGAVGSAVGLGASTARARDRLTKRHLEKSPFVYISPLLANGRESTCHGELWYAWLDDSVVVTVASDRWKATALARGLDRARIWIGDYGVWKTWYGGRNEDFREGPHFDARVEKVSDAAALETLLATYEGKYPSEIAEWRDVMREGNANGSRIVLRYTPI